MNACHQVQQNVQMGRQRIWGKDNIELCIGLRIVNPPIQINPIQTTGSNLNFRESLKDHPHLQQILQYLKSSLKLAEGTSIYDVRAEGGGG